MDYWRVMTDAWRITRRTPALWLLGLISAAQAMVYSLLIAIALLPISILPQLSATLVLANAGEAVPSSPLGAFAEKFVSGGADRLLAAMPAIVAAIVAIFAVWIVLGVFDVAAQPGMIGVTAARLDGRTRTVRQALAEGFGLWWRTAGLLAVAALPSLVLVLAIGVTALFTYTLPLLRHAEPNIAAATASQLVFMPLQGVVTVASVVLAVIVAIAMRYAVLRRETLSVALRKGWRVSRGNAGAVALVYLVATAIATVVALAAGLAVAGAIALLVALVAGVVMLATSDVRATAIAAGAVVGIVVLAAGLLFEAGLFAWTSSVWTIAWRALVSAEKGVDGAAGRGTTTETGSEAFALR